MPEKATGKPQTQPTRTGGAGETKPPAGPQGPTSQQGPRPQARETHESEQAGGREDDRPRTQVRELEPEHGLGRNSDTQRITELENEIAGLEKREPIAWVIGLLVIGTGVVLTTLLKSTSEVAVPLVTGITALAFTTGLTLYGRRSSLETELNSLREKVNIRSELALDGAARSREEGSYFDQLVRINLTNLTEYYGLVKAQTQQSFFVSTGVGIVGFLLIAAGLTVLALSKSDEGNAETVAFVSAGAGIFTEFISSVFFYLYSRTVQQLKSYHDSLLHVQNILLAFRIVDQLPVGTQQASVIEKMVGYLLTSPPGETPVPVRVGPNRS
jgi:uncharacterized membrane protein